MQTIAVCDRDRHNWRTRKTYNEHGLAEEADFCIRCGLIRIWRQSGSGGPWPKYEWLGAEIALEEVRDAQR